MSDTTREFPKSSEATGFLGFCAVPIVGNMTEVQLSVESDTSSWEIPTQRHSGLTNA
jgi:hypothetical protein